MNYRPTRKENINDISRHISMLNAEVSYYLSLAQCKIDDIDELERVLYDLKEEEYGTT